MEVGRGWFAEHKGIDRKCSWAPGDALCDFAGIALALMFNARNHTAWMGTFRHAIRNLESLVQVDS